MAPAKKSRESLETKPSRKLTEFFSLKPATSSQPTPGPSSRRTSRSSSEHDSSTRKNASAFSPITGNSILKAGKQKAKTRESNDLNADSDSLSHTIPSQFSRPKSSSPKGQLTPLASLQSSAASSQIALIASSQSDERELEMPKKIAVRGSPPEVEMSVDQWRQTLDAGGEDIAAMDVDDDDIDVLDTYATVPDTREQTVSEWVTPSSRPASPPLFTNSIPVTPEVMSETLPDIPEQLDSKSKTAQIIAQIKARHAAADSDEEDSPSMPSIPIKLDSSDDSELEDAAYLSRNKNKKAPEKKPSTSGVSSPSTSSPTTEDESFTIKRYSFRTRKTNATSPRKATLTTTSTTGALPPKKAMNPLDALLREKSRAEKRLGPDGLRMAEAAVMKEREASSSQSLLPATSFDSDNEESREDLLPTATSKGNWADESAARKAIQDRRKKTNADMDVELEGSPLKTGTPRQKLNAVTMKGASEAAMKMKDGVALARIIKQDGSSKMGKKSDEEVTGIDLWEHDSDVAGGEHDNDVSMSLEPSLSLDELSGNRTMNKFRKAIETNDHYRATLFLQSGVVFDCNSTSSPCLNKFILYLLHISLDATEHPLSDISFHALLENWASERNDNDSFLDFGSCLRCLCRLGLRANIVKDLKWNHLAPKDSVSEHASAQRRSDVLWRLITLSDACARKGRISSEDAPRIALMLLLISLDSTALGSNRRQAIGAMDSICNANPAAQSDIYRDLFAYIAKQSLPNQSLAVSHISCIANKTQHIARWIAFNLLISESTPSPISTSPPDMTSYPPLIQLLPIIYPRPGSGASFDVSVGHGGSEEEKIREDRMNALPHRISLLSIALSDIDGYIDQDRESYKGSLNLSSDSSEINNLMDSLPDLNKVTTNAEAIKAICVVLNKIHGSIVDNKLVHLDRSRLKARVQHLSLRVKEQWYSSLKERRPMLVSIQNFLKEKTE